MAASIADELKAAKLGHHQDGKPQMLVGELITPSMLDALAAMAANGEASVAQHSPSSAVDPMLTSGSSIAQPIVWHQHQQPQAQMQPRAALPDFRFVGAPPAGGQGSRRAMALMPQSQPQPQPQLATSVLKPRISRRSSGTGSGGSVLELLGVDKLAKQLAASLPLQPKQLKTKLHSLEQMDDKHSYALIAPRVDGNSTLAAASTNYTSSGNRELTQLLPVAWRESVKKVVSSAQQSATSQWKSLEGQVSSWVQDKVRVPQLLGDKATALTTGVAGGNTTSVTQSLAAQATQMISALGSGAMNMFAPSNAGNKTLTPATGGTQLRIGTADGQTSVAQQQSESVYAHAQKVKASLGGLANSIIGTLAAKAQQVQLQPLVVASPQQSPVAHAPAASLPARSDQIQ